MLNNLILIYILALQDNKYYVTKLPINSNDIIESYITKTNLTDLHSFFENGAHWLNLYPIIKIDHIIEDDISCDNIVKDYMATYGAHNVRGCSFNDVAYSEDKFKDIVEELNNNYEREDLEGLRNNEHHSSGLSGENDFITSEAKINQCVYDIYNEVTTCE